MKNSPSTAFQKIASAILQVVSEPPSSNEHSSKSPEQRAEELIKKASWKAAGLSGLLAVPPGPLGMVTVLPDLMGIWRLQAQLVADIAAVYGQSSQLKQEAMLYCLFRHGSAALLRDLVVRAGDRYLVRRAGGKALALLAKKVGLKLSQKAVGTTAARWVPVIGAVAMGWYAKFDTEKVGRTAMDLFRLPVEETPVSEDSIDPSRPIE